MGLIRLFLACGVVLAHGQDQVLGPLNELKGLEPSIDPLWTFNVLGGRSVIYFLYRLGLPDQLRIAHEVPGNRQGDAGVLLVALPAHLSAVVGAADCGTAAR